MVQYKSGRRSSSYSMLGSGRVRSPTFTFSREFDARGIYLDIDNLSQTSASQTPCLEQCPIVRSQAVGASTVTFALDIIRGVERSWATQPVLGAGRTSHRALLPPP